MRNATTADLNGWEPFITDVRWDGIDRRDPPTDLALAAMGGVWARTRDDVRDWLFDTVAERVRHAGFDTEVVEVTSALMVRRPGDDTERWVVTAEHMAPDDLAELFTTAGHRVTGPFVRQMFMDCVPYGALKGNARMKVTNAFASLTTEAQQAQEVQRTSTASAHDPMAPSGPDTSPAPVSADTTRTGPVGYEPYLMDLRCSDGPSPEELVMAATGVWAPAQEDADDYCSTWSPSASAGPGGTRSSR